MEAINWIEVIIKCFHLKTFDVYKVNSDLFRECRQLIPVSVHPFLTELSKMSSGVSIDGFNILCEKLKLSDLTKDSVVSYFISVDNYVPEDVKIFSNWVKDNLLKLKYNYLVESANNRNGSISKLLPEVAKLSSYTAEAGTTMDHGTYSFIRRSTELEYEQLRQSDTEILKSCMDLINNSEMGGYSLNQMVCILGLSGGGKSLFMFNEAVNFIKQKRNVIYCALGDLKEYSFIYRASTLVNKVPREVVKAKPEYYRDLMFKLVPEMNDHLLTLFTSPMLYTPEQLVSKLMTSKVPFDSDHPDDIPTLYEWADVIMIDYDANLKATSDSLYSSGRNAYNTLYRLVGPKKLVFTASQVSRAAWSTGQISMASIGESAGKIHVCDTVIALGMNQVRLNRRNTVGEISIIKGRDISEGSEFYFRDINGQFYSINQIDFRMISSTSDNITFIKNIKDYIKDGYLRNVYIPYERNSGGLTMEVSVSDDSLVKFLKDEKEDAKDE